jgi:anti-sigma regulatory factor (Ser/Thr protein kinase)
VTVSDSSTIAIVAEEAVANAYRHGSAEQVHVNISVDMDEIHMTVEDDGSGLSSHLEPGLGSRLLDHHAPGCWSRSAVPTGGVLLQVTFKAALLGT